MKMSRNYPEDKPSKHGTVRIPKDLVNAIEEFLRTDQAKKMGFLYITDIVTEGVREFLRNLGYYPTRRRFEHYNAYEDRISIIDNDAPKGKEWVDIWFTGDQAFCDRCEESECEHIGFIIQSPELIDPLKEHGWSVKDGKIVRR